MAGLVMVSGKVSDKAGTSVAADAEIALKRRPRFVSRAGDKLAHALEVFGMSVAGASALDVGASTGGFVDCLLQAGAARVTALDVGRGQLDGRVRSDSRVHILDKVNARYLGRGDLPYAPDFLTMDVSFISVTKVLPPVIACMSSRFEGLILIKPQFEAGPEAVGKGGVVRDPQIHRSVLVERGGFVIEQLGLELLGVCGSGLPGAEGNLEFFFRIGRGREKGAGLDRLGTLVDEILAGAGSAEMGSET
jgi:23S rRNA (cytidine1920-2'-O)/16S rRNA (cytidine1409-2'-O)-methyltransferase